METEMMYNDEIELSAYDGAESRMTRMQRVIGYASALADHYGNRDLLSKIKGLEDHKGTLTVTWGRAPTDGEKEILVRAWNSRIGDGADNVEHALAN
jgi:hypothetical protein